MKRIATLCAGIAAAIALTGCATRDQLDVTNGHLNVIQIQLSTLNQIEVEAARQLKQEPASTAANNACMLAGQPYSEGAIAAGRVCARTPNTIKPGGGMILPDSFAWQPESSLRIK